MPQQERGSGQPQGGEEKLLEEVERARRIFIAGASGFPDRIVEVLDRHGALRDQRVTCATVPGFGHVPPRVTSGKRRVFFASPGASAGDDQFVPIQYRRLWDLLAAEPFDLVLMRLGDAVKECAPLPGLRTHRSWWVAEAGVNSVKKIDGKTTIELHSGQMVPISRANAPSVREAGWT